MWSHSITDHDTYYQAHAEDEWPISSGRCNLGRGPVRVRAARSTSERVAAAAQFAKVSGTALIERCLCWW